MKLLLKTLAITSLFAISHFSAANIDMSKMNPLCNASPTEWPVKQPERKQWYQDNCAEYLPYGPIRSRDPQKATTSDNIIFPKD